MWLKAILDSEDALLHPEEATSFVFAGICANAVQWWEIK